MKGKSSRRVLVILVVLGWIVGAVEATAQTVDVWLTTHNQSSKLQQQASLMFTSGIGGNNPVVVDETRTYQEVEGFGASFTDSAAYLLNWEATPAARTEAMNNLFTRNGDGIGVSFVRNPMGASDLTRFHYSYDDNPPGGTDPQLNHFSIEHDQADIIPLVQQALHLNPDLKIMASPWSPPGWMKDSGSLIGGSLLPSMYVPYANYFVKYIRAYEAEGIPIHYVSLQNEPLYVPGDYPGMGMSAEEQRDLLRDYILPVFAASNISTRVLTYDHNWDGSTYPDIVLEDPVLQASSQIAGTAWHGYGGTPGVMLALNNQYPDKGNYQTEHSGGRWVGGDANQIASDFREIIHVMRSAGKAFIKWSLVLDENRGPNDGGCDSCSPLITVDSTTGSVSYNIDYYTLGHFSKFVLPGAHRIYSANANGVVSAAFLNEDGSKALVAFNDSSVVNTFQVEWGGKSFSYTLAGNSGATFTWAGTQNGSYTLNPLDQIQASSFDIMSGLITEPATDVQGGYSLGYADDGDYAVYRNVNFTEDLTNVNVRVASIGGGTVEFRLGGPEGTRISAVPMPNTGGWQSWQTISAPVSSVSGRHDLYVVYKGGGSIGNLNWFRFEGISPPGPAVQLIWTRQPGLATNGFPFARQPILVAADQFGVPSTNGLPSSLNIIVAQTAGGPLLGTTNVNIGSAGWNGVVQFFDLQIDSVGAGVELSASAPIVTYGGSENILLNGDFNLPDSTADPGNWEIWTTGSSAWANHENNSGVNYDGSFYMVVGGYDEAGGGCHQTVAATAGFSYELSVLGGADAWWRPHGEMRLFFLDAGGAQIGYRFRPTLNPADYDNQLDIPHPWKSYALSAIAPPGTTQVKVELMSFGTGSIWYENAVLTEQGFAPALSRVTSFPFSVEEFVPPISQTDYVVGISCNDEGVFLLQFAGTSGVEYFVETTTNLVPPSVWMALPGSTTLVTDVSGYWSHVFTNQSDRQFFRSSEVSP